jgi:hypothetical protein
MKEKKSLPELKRMDFSLVIRLWQARNDTDEFTWRGSINRVPSGNGDPIYFNTLEALIEEVKKILGEA